MKCRMFPGNWLAKTRRRGAKQCAGAGRRRQCNRPARRVTADVCIVEKDDFCQETYEMPIVSWKCSHELEGGEGGVQRHVQTADRR